MNQVFLSYSSEDNVSMGRVLNDLQSAKLDVWVAPVDLHPGSDEWKTEIELAIKNANCLTVLLSPDAYQSKWVKEEIQCAEDNKIKIFSFVIRGIPHEVTPLGLKSAQRFDARNDYEQAIETLIKEICRYLNIKNSRIAWEKTATFYWVIVDIQAARDTLRQSPKVDFEYVKRCFRQAHHHAKELQMTEIAERLSDLRQKVDGSSGTEWMQSNKPEIEGRLVYILNRIGELSRDNQPIFDPGPG